MGPLENFKDRYELIIYNNTDQSTCSQSQKILIMDQALTIASLGPLTLWEI